MGGCYRWHGSATFVPCSARPRGRGWSSVGPRMVAHDDQVVAVAASARVGRQRQGYLLATMAFLAWGLLPPYWQMLQPASTAEIVAHRVVWAFGFLVVAVSARRTWRLVARILAELRRLGGVALAAGAAATEWAAFVYGVVADRVVEVALGYFLHPMATVLLSVVVTGDRLTRRQVRAGAIAVSAVALFAADHGSLPLLAFTVAAVAATYDLTMKRLGLPELEGLAIQTALLAVPASVYIVVLANQGALSFANGDAGHRLMLVGAGVATAGPLLLFAAALNHAPLAGIGMAHFVTPLTQLVIGALVLREAVSPIQWTGFAVLCAALVMFSHASYVDVRRIAPASSIIQGARGWPILSDEGA